jgi:hypothetical protein
MTVANLLISTVSVDKAVKKVEVSPEFEMLRGRASKRGSRVAARCATVGGDSES